KPPRLARHLARAPPPAPPSPRGGGYARRPACGGDGSRGGDALRFGARYGSSDSLPMAPACLPPMAEGACGHATASCLFATAECAGDHTVARMLSRTKRMMSWVVAPGVNSSLTPMALRAAMS